MIVMRNRAFHAVSIDGHLHRQIQGERFTGRVHSVFDHAVNIDMDGLGLVTVISPRKPNGPACIKACPFPSLRESVRPRSRAVLTDREVVFPSAGVRISLDDARIWRRMKGVAEPAGCEELAARRTFLQEALAHRRGNHVALERGIGFLSRAVSSTDSALVKAGLDSLIGLGEGLTPAGDDFLLGMLCLFRSIPREARDDRLGFFLESFTERIGEYRDSTTFAGYSFLRYGSEGRFVEPLADLCAAVLSEGGGPGNGRRLEKSVAGLLSVGATSGLNMLMGVVLGVDLYMEEMRKRLKV